MMTFWNGSRRRVKGNGITEFSDCIKSDNSTV
jgi:nitrous oxidase accessory protein NosD